MTTHGPVGVPDSEYETKAPINPENTENKTAIPNIFGNLFVQNRAAAAGVTMSADIRTTPKACMPEAMDNTVKDVKRNSIVLTGKPIAFAKSALKATVVNPL